MAERNLQESYELIGQWPFMESSCGKIYQVREKGCDDGPILALKTVQTRVYGIHSHKLPYTHIAANIAMMEGEIAILKKLKQDIGNLEENHIMPMLDHGLWPDPDTNHMVPCFVMPCGSKSLESHYFVRSLPLWYSFALQITTALKSLSSLNEATETILHKDIKPSNIIIWNNKLYITDFGIANAMPIETTLRFVKLTTLMNGEPGTLISPKPSDPDGTISSCCGTQGWMAPEQGIPHEFAMAEHGDMPVPQYVVGPASDVYSAGHVLFWMLTGHQLTSQKNIDNISKCGNPNPDSIQYFGKIGGITDRELDDFKAIIENYYSDDHSHAVGVVANSPFRFHHLNIEEFAETTADLLKAMLEPNIDNRITSAEAYETMKSLCSHMYTGYLEKI